MLFCFSIIIAHHTIHRNPCHHMHTYIRLVYQGVRGVVEIFAADYYDYCYYYWRRRSKSIPYIIKVIAVYYNYDYRRIFIYYLSVTYYYCYHLPARTCCMCVCATIFLQYVFR